MNLFGPLSGKSATAITFLGFFVTLGAGAAHEMAKINRPDTNLDNFIGLVFIGGVK